MTDIYDVIIIGSGPAGFSAAIYASRADMKVLQFEGDQPGGQLTTTTDVENYAGFPEGIMGPKLMADMRTQAQRFGTETKFEFVTKVDFDNKPFTITAGSNEYKAHTVIIATGSRARRLGLANEERLWSKGVTSCATCDGAFFKDREVVVVGGGDSAMEEATFLTKFCSKVTILNRTESFKASAIMLKRAQDNEKVEIKTNVQVMDVLGEEKMTGVKLKDNASGEEYDYPAEGLFLAIGHIPNVDLFKDKLDIDEFGYLITQGKSSKTKVLGVFAAGDVQDHVYRQAITSAGSGCMAALDAQHYIEQLKHEQGE